MATEKMSKERRVAEIIRCSRDPLYFINTYCKILHPKKGLLHFNTFPYQDTCISTFTQNRFNIILKARQLGISTIVAAYCTWMANFNKGKSILIIATKKSTSMNLIKKVKVILQYIPSWLILSPITSENMQAVEFRSGSRIEAIPTSDDAGRSHALSLLVVDEAAYIKAFAALWPGLYSTLSEGGDCIVMSTPKGVGDQFHQLWSNAEAGLNEFHPMRLMWNVHPDRDEEWFKSECKNLGSQKKIASELLCEFATSGDTFISSNEMTWLNQTIAEPIARGQSDKNVWIWEHPKQNHEYIISADISRGDGRDCSAFHVIDRASGIVTAEYLGKREPDVFGDLLDEYGRVYNKALLCPENNSFGWATVKRLEELKYPRLYREDDSASVSGGAGTITQGEKLAGKRTDGRSREQVLSSLEELIRNKQLISRSARFVDQALTFVWTNGRPQAQKNRHDDLVMSLAIGAWLLHAALGKTGNEMAFQMALIKAMSSKTLELARGAPRVPGAHQQPAITFGDGREQGNNNGRGASPDAYREFRWILGK